MILVDTSVWIELIEGRVRGLRLPSLVRSFVTCAPVLQEVIQGLRPHPRNQSLKLVLMEFDRLSDPVPLELFLKAAAIYYDGRDRGITIRSSYDCLIAAIAIENDVPVWHRDPDFDRIAAFTNLKVVRSVA